MKSVIFCSILSLIATSVQAAPSKGTKFSVRHICYISDMTEMPLGVGYKVQLLSSNRGGHSVYRVDVLSKPVHPRAKYQSLLLKDVTAEDFENYVVYSSSDGNVHFHINTMREEDGSVLAFISSSVL